MGNIYVIDDISVTHNFFAIIVVDYIQQRIGVCYLLQRTDALETQSEILR